MAATPPPSVTPVPTPVPVRGDRSTFSARLDAFITWLATGVTQLAALVANCYANAVDAFDSALLAADQVGLAADQVALAADEADRAEQAADVAVGAANYQGEYSALTSYTRGQSTSYLGGIFYAKKTNLGITPVDGADWLAQAQQRGSGGSAVSAPLTLTNTSDGALSVATTTTGQAVKLPDATTFSEGVGSFAIKNTGGFDLLVRDFTGVLLAFVRPGESVSASLVDDSTSAGVWSFVNSCSLGISAAQYFSVSAVNRQLHTISLNGGRVLHLFGNTDLYGVVYDEVNNTWGSATLIASTISTAAFRAAFISNDLVLVVYCTATSTVGRTLSISGTSITVNTAATQSTNPITSVLVVSDTTKFYNLVSTGGSYVFAGVGGSNVRTIAFTISGTSVSVGSTVSIATTTTPNAIVAVTASGAVVVFSPVSNTQYVAQPYTVSGTTLTAGTSVTITVTAVYREYKAQSTTNGRLLVAYATNGQSSATSASLISVSANVATASTVVTGLSNAESLTFGDFAPLGGEKYVLGSSNSTPDLAVLVNTTGTLTVQGTLTIPDATRNGYVYVISSTQFFIGIPSTAPYRYTQYKVDVPVNPAGAPTILKVVTAPMRQINAGTTTQVGTAFPLPKLEDGSRNPVSLIKNGKVAAGILATDAAPLSSSSHTPAEIAVIADEVIFIERATTTHSIQGGFMSLGSSESKSWVMSYAPSSTVNFSIAQVEFAG